MRTWAVVLVAVALALVVFQFQPFTGSLPLVIAIALILAGVAATIAGVFRRT